MTYAQEKSGQRLHIVGQPGEEIRGRIVRVNELSQPICGRRVTAFRMTVNVPLGNCCKNCLRVLRAGTYHKAND